MRRILMIFFVIFLLTNACTKDLSGSNSYPLPRQLEDDLTVGAVEDVGLSASPLLEAVKEIRNGKYGEVHSMLVYKDGMLVVEEYFDGHQYQWGQPNHYGAWVRWDRNRKHNIMSSGKSITSAAVAIAVDQGYIESLQDSIFDYLPEYQEYKNTGKENITIEHLVTMTSGLEWDEWSTPYGSEVNDIIRLWLDCEDQIGCILAHTLVHEPGTHFTYSGGDMILLGEIVKNATGMDIEDFAGQYLFEPLGISVPEWSRFDNNTADASSGLRLTPREMLKFGVLYLNDGAWDSQQIIPTNWVEKSRIPYTGSNSSWFNNPLRPIPSDDGSIGRRGYGYTWWNQRLLTRGKKYDLFYAHGWGGQDIIVIPENNMVIVFTGGHYGAVIPNLKIMKQYILPAIQD